MTTPLKKELERLSELRSFEWKVLNAKVDEEYISPRALLTDYRLHRPLTGLSGSSQQVENYFAQMLPSILESVGHTYQAATKSGASRDFATESNLFFAGRAQIQNGMKILDLGCGTAGPSIDIAQAFPASEIDAITISSHQAQVARAQIAKRGLESRVRVWIEDYHDLSRWSPQSFDRAFFFESAGYSRQVSRLFEQVRSRLRSGGQLYAKEPALRAIPTTLRGWIECELVTKVYGYTLYTIDDWRVWLRQAGFTEYQVTDLQELIWTAPFFIEAMQDKEGIPTHFGREHSIDFQQLSTTYIDLRATA